MLLNGINHIALISKDIELVRVFYTEVFDAEVGPTRPHGRRRRRDHDDDPHRPRYRSQRVHDRGQCRARRVRRPMWGRGRLDHSGLQAASEESFETIRQRLIDHGASDGEVNDFGAVRSVFFRDPDGLEGEVLVAKQLLDGHRREIGSEAYQLRLNAGYGRHGSLRIQGERARPRSRYISLLPRERSHVLRRRRTGCYGQAPCPESGR